MVYGLTVSTARRRYWADLVTETGFLFFRASNLHITAASLASVAMFASMEWTPSLEELGSLVLNFSELILIGWTYQLSLHIITILRLHSFSKILLGTWILIGFR